MNTPIINLVPEPYVTVKLYETLTGITEKATRRRMERGVWIEGKHFIRDPQGTILINREACRKWAEGEKAQG